MSGAACIRITVLFVAVLTALAGCASSQDAGKMTDTTEVTQIIKSFNGAKNDPRNVPEWFAQGAAPPIAELRKYARYDCKVAEKPAVSSETATVQIKVLKINSEEEVGRVEWTLVKEDGRWKLKSAPLP